ncbi:MAG: TatD family hydrolase [SAR86 cluster bacterium]|jgi:TatD DNase family protein|nr:TatD family hydrolase [SAR86 cluster bacterium]
MNQYFDIGANLTHPDLQEDLESILENALNEGVVNISVTSSNLEESIKALDLVKKWPEILISTAGIHPHEAKKFNSYSYSEVKDLASNKEVSAIGETGLDYHRNYSSPSEQRKSFEQHVELAIELDMPLFLHVREAHQDFLSILDNVKDNLPRIVVHCFTGTESELDDYTGRDFYIGITGWICDERRGQHLKPLIKNIPEDRLLIETDSPYLLPRNSGINYRTSNEPKYLGIVAKEVASHKDGAHEETFKTLFTNSKNFFGLDRY